MTATGLDAAPASHAQERVPEAFRPVFARLRSEADTLFGESSIQLEPTHLQERPLSHVVRVAVRVAGDTEPKTHLFVKIFKPRTSHGTDAMRERVTRDFQLTRRTHQAMSEWQDVGAVRPVACYPEHLAIVTEETVGQTFGAYVEAHGRWLLSRQERLDLEQVSARVGRWIRAFQTIDPGSRTISLADLRSYIDVRLARMVHEPVARWSEADRARTLEHIDRLIGLVRPSDLTEVIVHADLAPGNVLIVDSRVVVLDFAMTRRGNRMHDLTRLYTQMEMMSAKPQFLRSTVGLVQRSLIHGFDPELTDQHPLFRLLLLLHRVNHLNTLSVRRERFTGGLYSAYLRHRHRRWIRQEVTSAPRPV